MRGHVFEGSRKISPRWSAFPVLMKLLEYWACSIFLIGTAQHCGAPLLLLFQGDTTSLLILASLIYSLRVQHSLPSKNLAFIQIITSSDSHTLAQVQFFAIPLYIAKSTLEERNLYMYPNSLCIIFASYEYVLITAINLSIYN